MTRTLRRTAAALAVALTAVIATTLGAMPAQADNQPQPILPIPPFTTPTPTPTPTPAPPKATSTPTKHASTTPAHTTGKKKAKAKKRRSSAAGTTTSSAVSAVTTASTTTSSAGSHRATAKTPRLHRATQVAAPDFAATTPVKPATATPQAAPTATAELVSSTSENALPLWVPALLLGFLGVLTAGTLRHRRRTGGV